MPFPDAYELKSLQAPKVSGATFNVFLSILEAPFIGRLFTGHLMSKSGFKTLDRFECGDVPPTLGAPDWRSTGARADTIPATVRWPTEGLPSAADYRKAYLSGVTTPMKVLECLLSLLDAADKGVLPIAAVIPVSRNPSGLEALRTMAAESTRRYQDGASLSDWDGVPVLFKDSFKVKGWTSGCGSGPIRALQKPADVDSATVAIFRGLGALLFGCAAMSEIGITVSGFNVVDGQVRNPHNLNHISGGSSSGCAAAVAAGLFPVSMGADGGGSIRLPSSLSGVVGLKPTQDRVPSEGDVFDICPSVGVIGPICASVADCLAAMSVVGTNGPRNIPAMPFPSAGDARPEDVTPSVSGQAGEAGKPLKGLRLGIYSAWFDDCDPEVKAACRGAVARMVELGAVTVEITVKGLELARLAHATVITSEMLAGFTGQFPDKAAASAAISRTGCDVRAKLRVTASPAGMNSRRQDIARKITTLAIAEVERALTLCDVIVTPSTAVPAPAVARNLKTGESDVMTESQLMRYMFLVNLTGHPGVSFPVGATKIGRLPIGLQLLGAPWSEGLLLKAAGACEAAFGRVAPAALPAPAERTAEKCQGPLWAPLPQGKEAVSLCACPLWAAMAAVRLPQSA